MIPEIKRQSYLCIINHSAELLFLLSMKGFFVVSVTLSVGCCSSTGLVTSGKHQWTLES